MYKIKLRFATDRFKKSVKKKLYNETTYDNKNYLNNALVGLHGNVLTISFCNNVIYKCCQMFLFFGMLRVQVYDLNVSSIQTNRNNNKKIMFTESRA